MSREGSSPAEGVVSAPVEMVLGRLEGRLGRMRPALGGAVARRVLVQTFLWKPNKSTCHSRETHPHIRSQRQQGLKRDIGKEKHLSKE